MKNMNNTKNTGKEKSFQQEVWETLSAINVNDKAEKKNGLSYLSWAWAWGVLMTHYPESHYEVDPVSYNNDDSAMVSVTLTIKKGSKAFSRKMWLPVMDYKNQAIINPSSVDINKNLMRCLTKAISMFGLGFYIYAGEDFPEKEKIVIFKEVSAQKTRQEQLIKDLKTSANNGIAAMKMHWLKLKQEEREIIGEEQKMDIYRNIAMKNEVNYATENKRMVSSKAGESYSQQSTQSIIQRQGSNSATLPHAANI